MRVSMRGVYAITPAGWAENALLPACEAVLEAGVCALQYREKPAPSHETARMLKALCDRYDTPLIINDAVSLARELGCGVHVGQADTGVAAARRALPTPAVVGASSYADLARAQAAQAAGASYVAFGSVFPSTTKPDTVACPLSTLSAARSAVQLPVVAIGGIHAGNAAQLVTAGADCIAVIDSIVGQDDPAAAVRSLRAVFDAHATLSQ